MGDSDIDVVLSIVLGVVFTALSAWSVVRGVTTRTIAERFGHALNLLMCLDMVTMLRPVTAWTTGMVPTPVATAIFGGAAVWFCYRAMTPNGTPHRSHCLFGAVKMLAMVWMSVAMAATTMRPTSRSNPQPITAGMTGMTTSTGATPASPAMTAPTWSVVGTVIVIALLAATVLWYGRMLLRSPIRPIRGTTALPDRRATALSDRRATAVLDDTAACLMATGMTLTLVTFV